MRSGSDIGLLLLRLFLGINLFLRHGLEKILHFSSMSHHFPDPIHIGSYWSFLYALLADAICSVLVAVGLGTRVAAVIIAVNIGVAFTLVQRYPFASSQGEMMLLYIGGFLALIFTGSGAYSVNDRF